LAAETQQGRWFTIAEAAPLLGVSVDTVRRRLKRGEIEARQVHTQHGPTWEVCLGTVQGVPAGEPGQDAQGATEGPAMLEALRLIGRLQEENRDLAGQLGYVRAQLAAAEDRVRALEAPRLPQDAPESSVALNLGAQPDEPTTEPSEPLSTRVPAPIPPGQNGSSWWRRWWAVIAGAGPVL